MKLATSLSYAADPREGVHRAAELERAGIDMIWVPEAYSFDAVSILGYLAAHTEHAELASGILPIYSRTPSLIGMTAAGLDAISGGRFVLGLGASGPQVIEGFHGVPYDRPLLRTRELIEICRTLWRRERLEYDGKAYQLPLPPEEGTGLGKPLKLINHPVRERIPIYVASLGPKNVAMTAELAEGWLPVFFHPERAHEVWGEDLERGKQRRAPELGELEIVAGGAVEICDEHRAAQLRDQARPMTALYVGGMGARGRNFYNNIFRRYGYEAEAEKIQELYLSGRKREAEEAVPDDFLRATVLAGDEGFVRDRVQAYQAAGVTRLSITATGDDPESMIAKLKEWTT
jgi:F420-dependent oxidoreductase-like protein